MKKKYLFVNFQYTFTFQPRTVYINIWPKKKKISSRPPYLFILILGGIDKYENTFLTGINNQENLNFLYSENPCRMFEENRPGTFRCKKPWVLFIFGCY